MSFNEWLFALYGIFSDDLTDEDYDALYEQYEWEVGENA